MTQPTQPGGWYATSPSINDLSAAYVRAQGLFINIPRTESANTGTYTYSYADLGTVMTVVRSALQSHGLAITQTAEVNEHDVVIWTTLLHESGQYIMAQPLRLPAGKTAQQAGSAITYARRYAVLALCGLATSEDDDGAGAAAREPARPAREPSSPPAPRTDDEVWMRAFLGRLDSDLRTIIQQQFKTTFGCSLAQLPKDRHAEARQWMETFSDEPVAQTGEDYE